MNSIELSIEAFKENGKMSYKKKDVVSQEKTVNIQGTVQKDPEKTVLKVTSLAGCLWVGFLQPSMLRTAK